MQLQDIISRVQSKLDDPDGTYITPDYVLGFAADTYDWVYNELRDMTGDAFDEEIIVLPAVQAGIPNLDSYQAGGQPLATLVQPRMIRWKLPGTDPTYWRRADGPLDFARDMPAGIPQLDSWAWIRYSIKLSNFSTALDLEVTGEFLFDPLTSPDSQIEIGLTASRVFACKLASEIGKARGNDKWVTTYSADADEAVERLAMVMVKAKQAITERVGRISRATGNASRLLTNH